MLKRSYRTQESLVRYWAQQAVELCDSIDDSTLAEPIEPDVEPRLLPRDDRCGVSATLRAFRGVLRQHLCWLLLRRARISERYQHLYH